MTLDGRVAVVTGAAGGLGAAVAERLGAHGATVERIDLEGGGRRLEVRDHAAVATAFREIAGERGRIDVLVNCAGIREIAPVLELSAEEWQRVIDV
ncbi:MAG: SDR family NAD(P)-dependent oxidoreductase, partial [Gaiellales bacterium]